MSVLGQALWGKRCGASAAGKGEAMYPISAVASPSSVEGERGTGIENAGRLTAKGLTAKSRKGEHKVPSYGLLFNRGAVSIGS